MIQSLASLSLDPTTMWILAIAAVLVFSLHFYLQRFMGKRPDAEPRLNVKR